jgi:hypothetical protein
MRELFGHIRIDLSPDVKLLTYGTARDVDAWVRQTLAENGGGRIEFQNHLDLNQPVDNCLQMIRTLRELGATCQRQPIY